MNANSCKTKGFEELIVSYIYDEASADERRRLETHILDCTSCMEEFAGLSNARLSVFEWQQESFADLETPAFVLPETTIAVANESESMFAKLGQILAGLRGPVLAFGGLLVVVGIAVASLFILRNNRQPETVAVAPVPAASVAASRGGDIVERPEAPTSTNIAKDQPAAIVAADTPVRDETRAIKATARVRTPQPDRRVIARNFKPARRSPAAKAPVLSDFDEADDRSLRLSDLFDEEIGSIR